MAEISNFSFITDIIVLSDPKKTPIGYSCLISTVGNSSADIGNDGGIIKGREYRFIATAKDLSTRPAAFLVSDLKFLNKEAPSLSGYATVNQTADSRKPAFKNHSLQVKKIRAEESANNYVVTQIKAFTLKERDRMSSFLKSVNLELVGEVNQICIYVQKMLGSMIPSDQTAQPQLQTLLELQPQTLAISKPVSSQPSISLTIQSATVTASPLPTRHITEVTPEAPIVQKIERSSPADKVVQSNPVKRIMQSVKEMATAANAFTGKGNDSKTTSSESSVVASSLSDSFALTIKSGENVVLASSTASISTGSQFVVTKTSNADSVDGQCVLENEKCGPSENTSGKKTASLVSSVGDPATPVFISFQSTYTARVLQLKRALESRGIPCWMAAENMVGNVQDAIGEALMVAPAIIICYSKSYRDSVFCKAEANTALRWKIPMVACCMEEGYEADYWLGVITAAAPGLDCSTEGKLLASLDRIEKELRAARRVQNAGVSAAHLSASSPTSTNAQKPQRRQSLVEWNANQAAQWLKSLSLYDCIPQKNRRLIDGAFLKELRTMKRDTPTEFVKNLSELFHFNAATSMKFRVELDKLE